MAKIDYFNPSVFSEGQTFPEPDTKPLAETVTKDVALQTSIGESYYNTVESDALSSMVQSTLSADQYLEQARTLAGRKELTGQVGVKSVEGRMTELRNAIASYQSGEIDLEDEVIDALPAIAGVIEEDGTKDSIIEQQFVDAVGFDLTDDIRNELIVNAYTRRKVSELLGDQDTLDWVSNTLSNMIAADAGFDYRQMSNKDIEFLGDTAEDIIVNFAKLPSAQKLALVDTVVRNIIETFDENAIDAAAAITKLITINPAEEILDEKLLNDFLLGIDITTIAGPLVMGAARMLKGGHMLNTMAKANPLDAGTANMLRNSDIEGKTALANAPVDEANASGQLIKNDLVYSSYDEQLATATDGAMRDAQLKVDEAVRQGVESGLHFREEFLADREIENALETAWREKRFDGPRALAGATFANRTENGVDVVSKLGTLDGMHFASKKGGTNFLKRNPQLTGTVKKDADGWFIEVTNRYDFTKQDFIFDWGKEAGIVATKTLSPMSYLADINNKIVGEATRLELSSSVLRTSFRRAAVDIMRQAGRGYWIPGTKANKKIRRVDNVLIQGDRLGDTRKADFTVDELRHTYGLDETEIRMYTQTRRLFDHAFYLRNAEERKFLDFSGYKWMPNLNEGPTNVRGMLGVPYKDAQIASLNLPETGSRIYNVQQRRWETITSKAELDGFYQEGLVLTRLEQTVKFGDQYYSHALVPRFDFQDLPDIVLHRRVGYVPKVNKNAFYFVKQSISGTLNGVVNKEIGKKTLRIADSLSDAKKISQEEIDLRINYNKAARGDEEGLKWFEDQGISFEDTKARVDSGEIDLSENIEALFDRELTSIERALERSGPSGGLFTGARSKNLGYGFNNDTPDRFSAFESLQRNMDNLSTYLPRNQWRVRVQQKMLTTFSDYIDNGSSFSRSAIKPEYEGTRIEAGFNATKEYIQDQLRILTKKEKIFANGVRRLAEWAEGLTEGAMIGDKGKRVIDAGRHAILNLAQTDVFALGRAMAFHPLLGWFNPVQLYVQAQGATIAASIHPVLGVKALKNYPALRMVWKDNLSDAYIAKLAKVAGMEVNDLKTWRELWINGGLRDSVPTNADLNAAADGASITMQSIRRANESGLMFFREGDLFTKGISLEIARLDWAEKNVGKIMDRVAAKGIIDDALRMSLNMTRANRAAWQRGPLSIPTQFMQIHAKFLEALFHGDGFKTSESVRLFIGQMALYGSAGIPFGRWASDGIINSLGLDEGQLTENQKKFIKGGIPDLMAYAALGANVEAGGRSSIAQGITDITTGILTGDFAMKDALGPFGAVASRFYKGVSNLGPLILRPAVDNESELTALSFQSFLSELASTASSWNNAKKAWFLYTTGKYLSGRGDLLYAGEVSPNTALAVALGFQPSVTDELYDLIEFNKMGETRLKELADTIMEKQRAYLSAANTRALSQAEKDNLSSIMAWYTSGLADHDIQIIREQINRRLQDTTSRLSEEVTKYNNNLNSGLQDSISLITRDDATFIFDYEKD